MCRGKLVARNDLKCNTKNNPKADTLNSKMQTTSRRLAGSAPSLTFHHFAEECGLVCSCWFATRSPFILAAGKAISKAEPETPTASRFVYRCQRTSLRSPLSNKGSLRLCHFGQWSLLIRQRVAPNKKQMERCTQMDSSFLLPSHLNLAYTTSICLSMCFIVPF